MEVVEGICIVEMVEDTLAEMGLDIDKMVNLYTNAGGDKMYTWWSGIYGEELVGNWIKEHENQSMSEQEMFIKGVVYGLTSYIDWLNKLN